MELHAEGRENCFRLISSGYEKNRRKVIGFQTLNEGKRHLAAVDFNGHTAKILPKNFLSTRLSSSPSSVWESSPWKWLKRKVIPSTFRATPVSEQSSLIAKVCCNQLRVWWFFQMMKRQVRSKWNQPNNALTGTACVWESKNAHSDPKLALFKTKS